MNYFETYLNFMKEYYTLGYNIWTEDQSETWENSKDIPTRLESIIKALDEYHTYCNLDAKYFILHKNKDDSKLFNYWIEPLIKDKEKNIEAYNKESLQHWENFWTIIKNNIQNWWD